MNTILMSLIVKATNAYLSLFEAEDDDYPDRAKVSARERALCGYVKKIAGDDKELQEKVRDCIEKSTWSEDLTYKPVCDNLRKLGFEIIEGK